MVYSVDKLRRSYQDFLFYAFLLFLQNRGILDYQKPNLATKEILNAWHYFLLSLLVTTILFAENRSEQIKWMWKLLRVQKLLIVLALVSKCCVIIAGTQMSPAV